jgi:hypothetical protein
MSSPCPLVKAILFLIRGRKFLTILWEMRYKKCLYRRKEERHQFKTQWTSYCIKVIQGQCAPGREDKSGFYYKYVKKSTHKCLLNLQQTYGLRRGKTFLCQKEFKARRIWNIITILRTHSNFKNAHEYIALKDISKQPIRRWQRYLKGIKSIKALKVE